MSPKARTTLAAFLVVFAARLPAQHEAMIFERYDRTSVADNVRCMIQDSRGFLWFGTADHLVRFDGYARRVYETEPGDTTSLPGVPVLCLAEDRSGIIWVGTYASGLARYDRYRDTFTRYRHHKDDPASISSNRVNAVCEDRRGNLWVGTSAGLNRFDRHTGRFVCYRQDAETARSARDNISAISEDEHGALWVSTSEGLYIFENEKFRGFEGYFSLPAILSNTTVSLTCQGPNGIVWICAEGSLYRFERHSRQLLHYPVPPPPDSREKSPRIQAIFDGGTFIWLGTTNGLYRFDTTGETFTRYAHDPKNYLSLLDNNITAILRDNGGCFWFGTAWKGINKRNSYRGYVKYYFPNPFDSRSIETVISSLAVSAPGVIWIGTYSTGLLRFNKYIGEFLLYQHDSGNPGSLSSNEVRCVFEDQQGTLWIATANGMDRFDREKRSFRHYRHDPGNPQSISSNNVSSIVAAGNQTLCVGTHQGFNVFSIRTGNFVRYLHDPADPGSISHDDVRTVYRAGDSTIWIGTRGGGLNRFDPASGRFVHYVNDPADTLSISSNTVLSLFDFPYDGRPTLWVGTEGGGLCRLDRETGKFFMYTRNDGLPDNHVAGICAHPSGHLWLATIALITRFDPVQQAFKNYEISAELPVNPNACVVDRDGEVFFGGFRGFVRFFPDSMKDNRHVPRVLITGFEVNNRPARLDTGVTERTRIVLSHDENTLSFEFTALDFNRPEDNRYAYNLDGIDDDWVYTDATRRRAVYTKLDPGEYVFRVKGSNNNGVWHEAGAAIAIVITPPWWRTTWAYLLYAAAIVSVLYAAHKNRLNRQRLQHQLQLERLEAEKLKEVDQLKTRFFSNISHEFRTPLTLILGPVEKMLRDPGEPRSDDALATVRRNAGKLLGLVNQLLDLSRVEAGTMRLEVQEGDLAAFVRRVARSFQSWAERKQISLECRSQPDRIVGYFDHDKVERILNNLISNGLKFTPEGGRVTVSVDVTEKLSGTEDGQPARIIVEDTGPGIPREREEHIFDRFYRADESHREEGAGIGLALVKELVELHRGRVRVESVVGEGARFVVELPIARLSYAEREIGVGSKPAEMPEARMPAAAGRKDGTRTVAGREDEPPILLVVEDNDDVRAYICGYLDHDYSVLQARDGVEALDLARETIPDLVVCDVMMPRMDGYEVCRALRQDERTSHVPVILLTARAGLDDRIGGLATGADDYLTKPFDTQELLARIGNLIEGRRLLREKWSKGVELRPGEVAVTSLDEVFLRRVMASVEANIGRGDYGVEDLARDACLSRSQVHRKLVALTNLAPAEFTRRMRLLRAKELLEKNAGTVAEVGEQVGFADPSHFAHAFEKEFGVLPGEIRRGHANQHSDNMK